MQFDTHWRCQPAGGYVGFDQQVWTPTVVPASGTAQRSVGLQLFYLSPNASEGYPGPQHDCNWFMLFRV